MSGRPDRRPFGPGPYVLGAQLKIPDPPQAYPFLPAIHDLTVLRPAGGVTFIVGENGSGKSTLVEALAIASGFSPQGGPLSGELGRVKRESESDLADVLVIETGPHKPRAGFFLRAESFFNVASTIDARDSAEIYGGVAMHEQSHGESFFALLDHRFRGAGLYILDEPEAALSPSRQLSFLVRLHELIGRRSQFIIATHSPIILGYPDAWIYQTTQTGLERVAYEDTDHFQVTRNFLNRREMFLETLLSDD